LADGLIGQHDIEDDSAHADPSDSWSVVSPDSTAEAFVVGGVHYLFAELQSEGV
jgi:hypothetical protein